MFFVFNTMDNGGTPNQATRSYCALQSSRFQVLRHTGGSIVQVGASRANTVVVAVEEFFIDLSPAGLLLRSRMGSLGCFSLDLRIASGEWFPMSLLFSIMGSIRLVLLALLVALASAAITPTPPALYYAYASYCPAQSVSNWACYWCNQTKALRNVVIVQVILGISAHPPSEA